MIKSVHLLNFLFEIRPESQSASLPYSEIKSPWSQAPSIIFPGCSEGLKSAATPRCLGIQGYSRAVLGNLIKTAGYS